MWTYHSKFHGYTSKPDCQSTHCNNQITNNIYVGLFYKWLGGLGYIHISGKKVTCYSPPVPNEYTFVNPFTINNGLGNFTVFIP